LWGIFKAWEEAFFMSLLLEAVGVYREFLRTYGEPNEIAEEEALAANEAHIWTLWHHEHEELFRGYQTGDQVCGYFQTPGAWHSDNKLNQVPYYMWVDCPRCEAAGLDDCEVCEGGGAVGISIPDCIDMKSEEEILATGSP
jgi:hypothetical protein